jgi:hypothetical protein
MNDADDMNSFFAVIYLLSGSSPLLLFSRSLIDCCQGGFLLANEFVTFLHVNTLS